MALGVPNTPPAASHLMFLLGAHVAAGLIVGKMTNQYMVALLAASVWDIDHLIPFYRHGVLGDPRRFWKLITSEHDPWGAQRNVFHNIFSWGIVSGTAFLFFPLYANAVSWAYASHLLLDALDRSDFYPFYPWKEITIRGPIPYFSFPELLFSIFLFVVFIAL